MRGHEELLARGGHLLQPRREFTCAAQDISTWKQAAGRAVSMAVMRARVEAGVGVRKLYNPKVLLDPATTAHLAEVAATGVGVRICQTPLANETLIIDSEVAILAGPVIDGVRSFSIVRSPDVVASMCSLFQATWDSSTELAEFLGSGMPVVDEHGRTILRMLGSGLTDEAAARRLGLSLRTYRRRVAELMELLDADSRFQAGLRARDLGVS